MYFTNWYDFQGPLFSTEKCEFRISQPWLLDDWQHIILKFKRLFGALKISVITSEVQRIQRIYVEKVIKYAPMQ